MVRNVKILKKSIFFMVLFLPKMICGQKWSKNGQNGQKWSKNGQKKYKKWSKWSKKV